VSKDQAIGVLLVLVGIVGIIAYGWFVFSPQWHTLTLQITDFIAVAGVLGILAWIGYTLATTPPPKPIEEIEKELEGELEKLEAETQEMSDKPSEEVKEEEKKEGE